VTRAALVTLAIALSALGFSASVAVLPAAAAPPGVGLTRKPATAPDTPTVTATAGAHAATRCGACHRVEGWEKVRFNHDPTGFPLRGAHTAVVCGQCHGKRFDTPVADTCGGCHRDRHGGEFGLHCEGCHDENSWRPLFQADAHRRTNFPLVGKHALIPCQECHGNLRDRSFARAASRCDACHEPDFLRTSATSVDHLVAGYSRECQICHNTFRFFPVSVAAHDSCWRISRGSHHGIRCLGCHTSLTSAVSSGLAHRGQGGSNCPFASAASLRGPGIMAPCSAHLPRPSP